MGEDSRLPVMPDKPTLIDFFQASVLAVAAAFAAKRTIGSRERTAEKIILACLLHDVGTAAFIRSDHGYWGAQMVEPYVDEEITWAIRMHQVIKFFPDEERGFEYPQSYRVMFGEDYQPPDYVVAEYERARAHPWYETALTICKNDDYSFNPDLSVELEEFEDIVGRHFKQPQGRIRQRQLAECAYVTLRRPSNAL